MRAVAVHPDVLVITSRVWKTSAVLVRAPEPAAGTSSVASEQGGLQVRRNEPAGDPADPRGGAGGRGSGDGAREAFLVDSPVYPDELDLTAQVAGQAGFAVAGLLATHGDWDHLLGRYAFPDAALGVAETTAARLSGYSGQPVRALRAFDDEHYVERPSGLGLGELQALPVPGRIALGPGEGDELELHPAPGHTGDGMAILVPWARTLVCGDYLSPVEIPTWDDHDGSRTQYRATLDVLRPLVQRCDWVVPGHGGPIRADRALRLLQEDVAYVDRLVLPKGRDGARQKALDAANRAA